LDFGLPILDWGKHMHKFLPAQLSNFLFRNNLKSKIQNRKWVGAIAIGVTFGMCGAVARAQSNFFHNKTIRVVRGGQPGDLYDLWTRHIATYLGRHIPGNPSTMVQNMPGAGSMIAANHIYKLAKPDGLTLGSINPGLYIDQLIGREGVQFDWAKADCQAMKPAARDMAVIKEWRNLFTINFSKRP
jgi:hypothetical protein